MTFIQGYQGRDLEKLQSVSNPRRLVVMSISECGCCRGSPAEGLRRGAHLTGGDECSRRNLRNSAMARSDFGLELDAGWKGKVFGPTARDQRTRG